MTRKCGLRIRAWLAGGFGLAQLAYCILTLGGPLLPSFCRKLEALEFWPACSFPGMFCITVDNETEGDI